MNGSIGPLFFFPIYRDYLWGGDRIAKRYRRSIPQNRCAESWEISARPEGPSVVEMGPLAGARLTELVNQYPSALMGEAHQAAFPLLIKLIDARETLSVQVHPNQTTALRSGGEPKTEMWYVLDADPGAAVYLGFQEGVTRREIEAAARAGTVDQLLVRRPVSAGEAIFVPGGCVHAIGAGCLMFECQQSSNTTFRLFDWNRMGRDGRPRELHVERALEAIDWGGQTLAAGRPASESLGAGGVEDLVQCDYFRVRRIRFEESFKVDADPPRFQILFMAEGEAELLWNDGTVPIPFGRTVLLPAEIREALVHPSGRPATALLVDVPLSA
ncbi:MAG: class I mannose-6-phosphate isomerase [Kiritimatiellae bacterium]|nr:class I mannose-6-phosphate isomerase [Kiritimatiellia bacterium]MDW8458586.1 class I mannose-6-phosphate isomerase [Verrucomicrobiota bacterium]